MRAVAGTQSHALTSFRAAFLTATRSQGWRPARPGEFTRRAFHAGKLDLTQAEGLADLLNAETAAQRRTALAQATGLLSRQVAAWRAQLLRCVAHAEASIDFGEDERLGDVAAGVAPMTLALRSSLADHLSRSAAGAAELTREGVRVTLGGAPNAGKSSLLNALAGREAAIVSPQPGTTRDVVTLQLAVGAHKLLLSDTAGLRACGHDAVEAEGVRRAERALREAHLRVLVLDASRLHAESLSPGVQACFTGATDESSHSPRESRDSSILVVLNKADLLDAAQRAGAPALLPGWLAAQPLAGPWLVSCATGEGLDQLSSALQSACQQLLGARDGEQAPALTRARHAHWRALAVSCLDAALAAAPGGEELAAEELRNALRALGRVTGDRGAAQDDVEATLDVVFSEFCVGK